MSTLKKSVLPVRASYRPAVLAPAKPVAEAVPVPAAKVKKVVVESKQVTKPILNNL